MAETSTLARPYAEALFDLARAGDRLAEWSEILELLAQVVEHEDVRLLIGNPRVDDEQLAGIILDLLGDRLDDQGRNLIRVLAEYDRLRLVPEIRRQYEALRADAENRVDVEVVSAVELPEDRHEILAKALESTLGRRVNLICRTDPELIAGAVVRAGDQVIDGSVRAQLERMKEVLAH